MNAEYFMRLEERRTRALVDRDMACVEEMHAPDYELVTPAGRILSRASYLELIEEAPGCRARCDAGSLGSDDEVIRGLTRRSTGPFKTGRLRDGAHFHHSGARS